ncbi:DNA repair protein rad52 [Dissophora globulifera]|uniref:DNA repair protein rad52 n=1 Tax=Dissophora globulifera TaxID=979702 RepID=A0A9P6RQD3_9FUNG|nr:DNA repair protein rad52 [Dissophora globulifera]
MFPKAEPGAFTLFPDISTTNGSTANHINDYPSYSTRMSTHGLTLPQSAAKLIPFNEEERLRLNEDLPKFLPPHFTATRAGPGRSTLTYIEGWRIKNLANKMFGFDGWSSSIMNVSVDFLDVEPDGKVCVGVSVMVKVTLKDGTFHEDIGYGSSENQKSKASSFEKAKKEATTDGLKRALTSFGNLLGTCLYDKNYCKHLSMQRIDKPKFDPRDVYDSPIEGQAMQHPQQMQHQQQKQAMQHTRHGAGSSSAVISNPFQSNTTKSTTVATHQALQSTSNAGAPLTTSENVFQQNTAIQGASTGQRPQTAIQTRPSLGVSAAQSTHQQPGTVASTATMNQHDKSRPNIKMEDDDDIFFGADIEDTRASQPESPRMSEFDNIDMDVLNESIEDSPVKPTAGHVTGPDSTGQAVLRRSGSLTRSTSSPVLLHVTPTKATAALQQANNPWAPKSTAASSSSTGAMTPVANPFAALNALSSKTRTPTPPFSNPDNSPAALQMAAYQQQQRSFASKESSSPPTVVGQPVVFTNNKNVFRANSLAASNASSGKGIASSSNQSSAGRGYKATTPSTAVQNIFHLNSAQSTGLKRPLVSSSTTTAAAANKEPRLE